jgi:hypothetical protein
MEACYTIKKNGKHVRTIIDTKPDHSWENEICTTYGGDKFANKVFNALNTHHRIMNLNINSKTSKSELLELILTKQMI